MTSRKDAATYVGEMARQLAKLARAEGMDALGYLLEVATLEAEASGKKFERVRPTGKGHYEVQRLQQ